MITGLEKVSYYPNANKRTITPIVSNSSLLKNKLRFAETAPKFGYRPLRKTSDMFGNVIANTKLVGVPGITNSNLLQTKNTLTENAPKPRVIGKEVQRLMNAGVLPEYMGLQKGPERKEVVLLQQMMGNGAKLIALELIRGTLVGKNYKNIIPHGNSNQAARAKTQYDQLVHDYSELINKGQQNDKSKVNKLLENFTAKLSQIYGMDMSLPVPERELNNVVNELADIRQASQRLFDRNNDNFTQVIANLDNIRQLGAGAQPPAEFELPPGVEVPSVARWGFLDPGHDGVDPLARASAAEEPPARVLPEQAGEEEKAEEEAQAREKAQAEKIAKKILIESYNKFMPLWEKKQYDINLRTLDTLYKKVASNLYWMDDYETVKEEFDQTAPGYVKRLKKALIDNLITEFNSDYFQQTILGKQKQPARPARPQQPDPEGFFDEPSPTGAEASVLSEVRGEGRRKSRKPKSMFRLVK